jgi:hypothetical protein
MNVSGSHATPQVEWGPVSHSRELEDSEGSLPLSSQQGGVNVIPKMFNILNSPTVVFACCDAQLHLKTLKNLGFFKSQL